jgi:hypothetical protein
MDYVDTLELSKAIPVLVLRRSWVAKAGFYCISHRALQTHIPLYILTSCLNAQLCVLLSTSLDLLLSLYIYIYIAKVTPL